MDEWKRRQEQLTWPAFSEVILEVSPFREYFPGWEKFKSVPKRDLSAMREATQMLLPLSEAVILWVADATHDALTVGTLKPHSTGKATREGPVRTPLKTWLWVDLADRIIKSSGKKCVRGKAEIDWLRAKVTYMFR